MLDQLAVVRKPAGQSTCHDLARWEEVACQDVTVCSCLVDGLFCCSLHCHRTYMLRGAHGVTVQGCRGHMPQGLCFGDDLHLVGTNEECHKSSEGKVGEENLVSLLQLTLQGNLHRRPEGPVCFLRFQSTWHTVSFKRRLPDLTGTRRRCCCCCCRPKADLTFVLHLLVPNSPCSWHSPSLGLAPCCLVALGVHDLTALMQATRDFWCFWSLLSPWYTVSFLIWSDLAKPSRTRHHCCYCRDPKADLTFVLQLMVPGPPYLALTIAWSGSLPAGHPAMAPQDLIPAAPSAAAPAAAAAVPEPVCNKATGPFSQLLTRCSPLTGVQHDKAGHVLA